MLHVVVVGVGAMGSLFAGYLSSLCRVTVIGHWPQQVQALRKGLTIVTPDDRRLHATVAVTTSASSVSPASIALILVKSYQTAQAAYEVAQFLEEQGLAITLQNGAGNDALLAGELGRHRVILGTTTEGATLVEPGIVRHAGKGLTVLQHATLGRQALLLRFSSLLREAGFQTRLSGDIESLVWQKLVVNAAINPLSALLEVPNGGLISVPATRVILRRVAQEAGEVAQALGHDIDPATAVQQAEEVAQKTHANYSSMLQDVLNGRPTELESITGAILQSAQAAGIAAPLNSALYDLMRTKLAGQSWQDRVLTLPRDVRGLFLELTGP